MGERKKTKLINYLGFYENNAKFPSMSKHPRVQDNDFAEVLKGLSIHFLKKNQQTLTQIKIKYDT